jgi:hypothetical protein
MEWVKKQAHTTVPFRPFAVLIFFLYKVPCLEVNILRPEDHNPHLTFCQVKPYIYKPYTYSELLGPN